MSLINVSRATSILALIALPIALVACKDKTDAGAPPAASPVATNVRPPSTTPAVSPDSFRVLFETSRGNFTVDVKRASAPIGVDRFYEMVQMNYFAEARFFRVVPGFVAQFGMHADPNVNKAWMENLLADDPVVESNKRGTLVYASMMRPGTRSSQFFINFGDNTNLDAMGFAPFGHVVDGMAVVDSINAEYGESPDQERIAAEGNAYLSKAFPKLDYIKAVRIVPR